MYARTARAVRQRFVCAAAISLTAFVSPKLDAQLAAAQPRVVTPVVCETDTSKQQHAALTVEGGGTLGTYEGGFTWTLIEIFRQRRLMNAQRLLLDSLRVHPNPTRAAPDTSLWHVLRCLPEFDFHASAGASAGSINAFIAANEWCSVGDFKSDAESPFWSVWVSTGLSELLPRRKDPDWKVETGLFTRTRFAELFRTLDDGWKKAKYGNKPCTLAFGAAITRLADDSLAISNQVHARNQRYASAFTIAAPIPGIGSAGSGPRYLRPPKQPNEKLRLGSLVELPLSTDGSIKHEYAQALIKASSGYPLAFEPHPVRYCPQLRIPMTEINGTQSCDEKDARTSYFVDGGVFDNGPLTLSYALALADSQIALDNLYMLYLNPSHRRLTGNRYDRYNAGRTPLPREPQSVSGDQRPQDEEQLEGLDAVAKLFAAFIPSARQYELQIAARFLPTVQDADQRLSQDSARLIRAVENNLALRVAVDSEYTLRKKTYKVGRAAGDTLTYVRDSLRYALASCRMQRASCSMIPDSTAAAVQPQDSTILPPQLRNGLDSEPPRVRIDTSHVSSLASRRKFDRLLFVSQRWHPLGGDWLFGFGGFIGQPLREYDFYVGEYDALIFIATHMLCKVPTDILCPPRQLASLISDEGVPLTRKARAVLRFLYDEEFDTLHVMPRLSRPADTSQYPVLIGIVKAMGSKMGTARLPARECRAGGAVARLSCLEGMDTVFATLRNGDGIMDHLREPSPECSTIEHACRADVRFKEFVRSPHLALNQLAGEVLQRVSETTPGKSGLRFPLTVAHAMYLSTNERAREGFDAGSVSLPTLPGFWRLYYLIPSSVGGFGGVHGWYAEWAVRWHANQSLAIGVAPRILWRSALFTSSTVRRGQIFVPALRAEIKLPSRLLSPWISTIGGDIAMWNDLRFHQFGEGGEARGLTGAFTTSLLAQRLRLSIYKTPGKYDVRYGSKPPVIVSVGPGDTSGMAYWLTKILFP